MSSPFFAAASAISLLPREWRGRIEVTVHGDCPDFRGGDDVALEQQLCRRENGTVPLGRKGTGTFFGPGASTKCDDHTGRKMSQSPAARERLRIEGGDRRSLPHCRRLTWTAAGGASSTWRRMGDAATRTVKAFIGLTTVSCSTCSSSSPPRNNRGMKCVNSSW